VKTLTGVNQKVCGGRYPSKGQVGGTVLQQHQIEGFQVV
jgi:hypothetical protein